MRQTPVAQDRTPARESIEQYENAEARGRPESETRRHRCYAAPRPHKRTAIHKASENPIVTPICQPSPTLHICISKLWRFTHWHFRKTRILRRSKVSVDWVCASDVVARSRPMTGEHAMTTSSPALNQTSCAPRVPARWRLALGHHGSRSAGSGFKLIAFSTDIFPRKTPRNATAIGRWPPSSTVTCIDSGGSGNCAFLEFSQPTAIPYHPSLRDPLPRAMTIFAPCLTYPIVGDDPAGRCPRPRLRHVAVKLPANVIREKCGTAAAATTQ